MGGHWLQMNPDNRFIKIINSIFSILAFAPYIMCMCLYLTTMLISTILLTIGALMFSIKDWLYKIVVNKS